MPVLPEPHNNGCDGQKYLLEDRTYQSHICRFGAHDGIWYAVVGEKKEKRKKKHASALKMIV